MSKRWIAVLAVALGMAILWSLSHQSPPSSPRVGEEVTNEAPTSAPDEVKSEIVESTAGKTPPAAQNQNLHENFNQALVGLQTCFALANSPLGPEGEPSLEAWKSALRPDFGEVVLEAEDWTNTHLVLPSGEKRRIRIESEMGDDNRVTRKLKYAGVDKDDLPVPINLPAEQTVDPNETFIASLEKEGQVTMVEKAQRLYFSDGSEVMSVQRNSIVSEIEINKAGRSFHCWNLDKSSHQCDCL